MVFVASFGTNSIKNGSNVNLNSTTTAPALFLQGVLPGFHTVTMVEVESAFLHYIKSNMASTGRGGSVVARYEGPLPPVGTRRQFILTLWRQSGGRLSPPPRGPVNRARFNLDTFVAKHGLLEVSSVRFGVRGPLI